jgi:hypothetical protein
MSITVQVGNQTFQLPQNGEQPGWGEETTAWMQAVTDSLANVQGSQDILQTSANISNNVSVFANINGMSFDINKMLQLEVDYYIKRIYNGGTSTIIESGKIIGNYDGSNTNFTRESIGDVGIEIDATSLGQFQYKSSNLTNHISSIIVFKAKAITQ